MIFLEPMYFFLLLFLIPLGIHYVRRTPGVPVPARKPFYAASEGVRLKGRSVWARHFWFAARMIALFLLVTSMARPQTGASQAKNTSEGLDIVLVVDTSQSMEGRDFVINNQRPTRLEVVKHVLKKFISERPSDRIGMVIFGTEAFTQAPLTLDHNVLLQFLDQVNIGMAGESTAIGDGLATAVARLKDLDVKSKVVILLTDGSNVAGRVDPVEAAEAAKTFGVRAYTIGVGSQGPVPIIRNGRRYTIRADLDEDLLKEIATKTNGRYFRAQDTEGLIGVYETIDKLEKTKIEVDEFRNYEDRYGMFLFPAVLLLILEALFKVTRFERVP